MYQNGTNSGHLTERAPGRHYAPGARLVALIMWHGGDVVPRVTAPQHIFWGFSRVLSRADYHGVFLDLGETIGSAEENAALETDYVGVDNLNAMRETTEHRLARGHRRVALVTWSEPVATVQDRLAGYRAAMRRPDSPAALEWELFDHLFRLPPGERPTPLLCANDWIALAVAARLAGLGLPGPGEVALVGFDGQVQALPPCAEYPRASA